MLVGTKQKCLQKNQGLISEPLGKVMGTKDFSYYRDKVHSEWRNPETW